MEIHHPRFSDEYKKASYPQGSRPPLFNSSYYTSLKSAHLRAFPQKLPATSNLVVPSPFIMKLSLVFTALFASVALANPSPEPQSCLCPCSSLNGPCGCGTDYQLPCPDNGCCS
ncbi:hypothetical protein F4779DRAFT_581068 [Xylariaceae sp. FL0662B]|nr:hypothetical protein F4779DRAFT_581068 [Xylariaceae sp. FL0662B]